jgi:hypothetical protein
MGHQSTLFSAMADDCLRAARWGTTWPPAQVVEVTAENRIPQQQILLNY